MARRIRDNGPFRTNILGNYNISCWIDVGNIPGVKTLRPGSSSSRTLVLGINKFVLYDYIFNDRREFGLKQSHDILPNFSPSRSRFFQDIETKSITVASSNNFSSEILRTQSFQNDLPRFSTDVDSDEFLIYVDSVNSTVDRSATFYGRVVLSYRDALRDKKYNIIRDLDIIINFSFNIATSSSKPPFTNSAVFSFFMDPFDLQKRYFEPGTFESVITLIPRVFRGRRGRILSVEIDPRNLDMLEQSSDIVERLRSVENVSTFLSNFETALQRISRPSTSVVSFNFDREYYDDTEIIEGDPSKPFTITPIPIFVRWSAAVNSATILVHPQIRGDDFARARLFRTWGTRTLENKLRTLPTAFSFAISTPAKRRNARNDFYVRLETKKINFSNKIKVTTDKNFDTSLPGVQFILESADAFVVDSKANLESSTSTTARSAAALPVAVDTLSYNITIKNNKQLDLSKYEFKYALREEADSLSSKEYNIFENSQELQLDPNKNYVLDIKVVELSKIASTADTFVPIDPENIFLNNSAFITQTSTTTASLENFYTSSKLSNERKKYYYQLYNNDSSNQQPILSISYGHFHGSGSISLSGFGEQTDSPTRAIYRQTARLLYDSDSKDVINISGSRGELKSIYVLNFNNKKVNNNLDPGTWELTLNHLSGSGFISSLHTGSNIIPFNGKLELIDNFNLTSSYDDTVPSTYEVDKYTNIDACYKVISGSLLNGAYLQGGSVVEYGRIYPEKGMIILDSCMLDASASFNTTDDSQTSGDNIQKMFVAMCSNSGSLRMRNVRNEAITSLIIPVKACQLNYSNNPTFVECYPLRPKYGINTISSSWCNMTIRNKDFIGSNMFNTRTYPTTIGLYDEEYNLLAIGKISKPQAKSRLDELLFTVNLKY